MSNRQSANHVESLAMPKIMEMQFKSFSISNIRLGKIIISVALTMA